MFDSNVLDQAKYVACIGSRDITEEQYAMCVFIGFSLVKLGKYINSGNAMGADAAYASGGNEADPTHVNLYLPDMNYNPGNRHILNNIISPVAQWSSVAKEHHFKYDSLSPYAQKAMNRNAGIVLNADLVIALPNKKKSWGGGTGHGMKIGKAYDKPVWNLNDEELKINLLYYLNEKVFNENSIHS